MATSKQYRAWLTANGHSIDSVKFTGQTVDGEAVDTPVESTWPDGVAIPAENELPSVEDADSILDQPQQPPQEVIDSASVLQGIADKYNAQFTGLDISLLDGFETFRQKVIVSDVVPLAWKALVIDDIRLGFDQLEYRYREAMGEADVWAKLPELAQYL